MNSIPPIATTGLIIFMVLFIVSSIMVLIWRILTYRYRLKMHDVEHAPRPADVGADKERAPSALWTRIPPAPYLVAPQASRNPHVNHRSGPDLSSKPLPQEPETRGPGPVPVERSYFDVEDDSEDDEVKTQKGKLASRVVQRPRRAYSRNRLSNLSSSLSLARSRVAQRTPVINIGPPNSTARTVNLSPLERVVHVRQTEDVPIVSTPRDLQINMGGVVSPRAPSPDRESLEERYASAQPGDARSCKSFRAPRRA